MPTKKIVLVTTFDEVYRTPLLRQAGYFVRTEATLDGARKACDGEHFDLILMADKDGSDFRTFCDEIRRQRPQIRVAVLAQWSEYIAKDLPVDAVIRVRHSPTQFLSTIRTLVGPSDSEQSN